MVPVASVVSAAGVLPPPLLGGARMNVVAARQRIASGSPFEPTIGFSRALRVGDRLLVSGTGPVLPGGGCPDGAAPQARRCFEIIRSALEQGGATLDDIVRTRMFIVAAADAAAVGAVHGELLGHVRPAATMVVVAGLLDPAWRVEIEAEAELPAGSASKRDGPRSRPPRRAPAPRSDERTLGGETGDGGGDDVGAA